MRRSAALLMALGAPAAVWAGSSRSDKSWTPAEETSIAEMAQEQVALGMSPRPTDAPKGLLGRMLVPRIEDYTLGPETCGFDQADGISITCITRGNTCTYSSSAIGCCVPNQPCNVVKTTCLDYSDVQSGKCDLPNDFHTLCCRSSSAGACFTWVLSTTGTGDEPDSTFTLLDCASRSGTAVMLDYDPAWSRTHSFAAESSTTATTTSSSQTATNTGNNDNGGGGGGGGGTNIGAIVGGAVGGVAGLALIGAGIWFLLRRKKKDAASKTPSTQQSPPQHSPPQPVASPSTYAPSSPTGAYPSGVPSTYQGYPPSQQSPQGYDPHHMSVYSQAGFNQQYPQQQPYPGPYAPGAPGAPGYPQGPYPPQQYSPVGFQPPSTVSPPPHTTPSPGVEHNPHGQPPPVVNELAAVNPVGHENNRAELGPGS